MTIIRMIKIATLINQRTMRLLSYFMHQSIEIMVAKH
jgi:hypothetical protein